MSDDAIFSAKIAELELPANNAENTGEVTCGVCNGAREVLINDGHDSMACSACIPAQARETVGVSAEIDKFAIGDIHDAASEIMDQLHVGVETRTEYEIYDCRLCGAVMYPCMDYTHEKNCPYEIFTKAIDAFGGSVERAQQEAKERV